MPDPALSNRLKIGRIATAHGVRGLVKLLVTAEDAHLIETAEIFTGPDTTTRLNLTLKNPIGRYWIAEVEGVTERNGAEALRHTELWIDRDNLPQAAADEYYASDLIGLKAVNEQGQEIGKVISVSDFGASPLLEIKPSGKSSFYLPFTKENVLKEDIAAGTMVVKVPDGLF